MHDTISRDERPDNHAVLDVDSHEMVPLEFWAEVFDEAVAEALIGAKIKLFTEYAENSISRPDITSDSTEISEETVWTVKGPGAPGAIDFGRRSAVLDAMGVDRQLVYPTFGLFGYAFVASPFLLERTGYDTSVGFDPVYVGRKMIHAHNKWAARVTRSSGSRVRPVAIVMTESVPQMMSELENVLASGCRAIMIPAGVPPADTSPADKQLDPFWAMIEKADIPVTIHIGTEPAFFASWQWTNNVPEFVPSASSSIEFPIEPNRAAINHYPAENFLVSLILGGVFERHPKLRFGVIELAADWVGPFSARLDTLADVFASRLKALSMKPSEYIIRNVRVTPFHYEALGDLLRLYPQLEDILVYSSDYPHREGGKYSKKLFGEKLESFPTTVREKFFSRNAELLLPA